MSAADDYLANNRDHADHLTDEDRSTAEPSRRIAVVTCMDARIDPVAALGIRLGEAHVIRNAGGIITEDVIRSLTLSQSLLDTREIMLVRHTRCGLHGPESALSGAVAEKTGAAPAFALGAFEDVDEDVRQSLTMLRESPWLPHTDAVRGFVYDVETGLLREVAP